MVPVDFSETSVRNSATCCVITQKSHFSGLLTEICSSHGRDHGGFDDGSVRIIETSLLCQVQDCFGDLATNVTILIQILNKIYSKWLSIGTSRVLLRGTALILHVL